MIDENNFKELEFGTDYLEEQHLDEDNMVKDFKQSESWSYS